VFLEHKSLLGKTGSVPEEEYLVPLGVGDIKREGNDLTAVAVGYMVELTLQLADFYQEEKGGSIEVIDPRTLEPLDMVTIINSVRKTGRVIIVDEDTLRCGPGAEIGMRIMEEAFDSLDAPVKRIGAANVPIAAAYLEQFILPQPQQISDAMAELLGIRDALDVRDRMMTTGRSVRKQG
jgi:pyruvate dehydrogenase E1 component beta subunit